MTNSPSQPSRRTLLRTCVGAPVAASLACASEVDRSAAASLPPLGPPLPRPAEGKIRVAFLITAGAEIVDFGGPWGVFEYAVHPDTGNPFELYTVAESVAPLEISGGMVVVPKYGFADAPPPHVVIVPALGDHPPAALDWLVSVSKSADLTVSICTGAFALAEAGLLDGRTVTTHHSALTILGADFPAINVVRGARFIDDGNVSTAGGLTSGIDLALHIVERYLGPEMAERTANLLEYQGKGWQDPSSNAAYLQRPRLTGNPPRCPVCEAEIGAVLIAEAPSERYGGRTYRFCSPDCKARFDQSPDVFAAP